MLIDSAIEAYQVPRDTIVVVNSCPFIIPITSSGLQSLRSSDDDLDMEANQKAKWIPVKLANMSFQRSAVMPVKGISAFRYTMFLRPMKRWHFRSVFVLPYQCNCAIDVLIVVLLKWPTREPGPINSR